MDLSELLAESPPFGGGEGARWESGRRRMGKEEVVKVDQSLRRVRDEDSGDGHV